jgi:putative SOS response-associated peptidase YedK
MPSFTILVTLQMGIRDLHNPMPVMLTKEGFEPWLTGEIRRSIPPSTICC